MDKAKNHNSNADGLRGIACLIVFFSHLAYTFYPYMHAAEKPAFRFESFIMNSPFTFFYSGSAGVYVFFVLSGFVLSASFSRKFNAVYFSTFLIKRYIRLMIPVFFSCIAGYLVFSNLHLNSEGISEWASQLGTFDYSLAGAVYSGLIGAFKGEGLIVYNWVLWTMKIEIVGSYVLALFFISPKSQSIMLLALASLVFFVCGFNNGGDSFFYGLSCFMAGAVIYKSNLRLSNLASFIALVIGLYFAGYKVQSSSYSIFFGDFNTYLTEYSLFLMSGILIVLSALKSSLLDKVLSSRLSTFLGKISFSLYLIQMLTIYIIAIPLYHVLSIKVDSLLSSLVASVICIVISMPLSWLYYVLFDKTAVKLSNKTTVLIMPRKAIQ